MDYRVDLMNRALVSTLCLFLVSASLPAHAAKVKCSDFKSQKKLKHILMQRSQDIRDLIGIMMVLLAKPLNNS